MKISKDILLITTLPLALSCVKKQESLKVDPSLFFGVWSSPCKQESSNLSTSFVNTISAEKWSFVRDQFNSPDCSGSSVLKMRVESTLTFEGEGEASKSKNYKQVIGKTYVTPLTQGVISDLKASTSKDSWTLGLESEYDMGFAEENTVVYNVMKLVDGNLCLGQEDEVRDKSTPDKRPVAIDLKDCLRKIN